jgi:hypothetical protein
VVLVVADVGGGAGKDFARCKDAGSRLKGGPKGLVYVFNGVNPETIDYIACQRRSVISKSCLLE